MILRVLLALALISSCKFRASNLSADWETRRWMDKVARATRYNVGGMSDEDIEKIGNWERAAIVDYMLNDSDFFTKVIDFNLFFLGLKVNSFDYDNGKEFTYEVYSNAQIIPSAAAIVENGDYFKLFDGRRSTLIINRLSNLSSHPNNPDLPKSDTYTYWIQHILNEDRKFATELMQATSIEEFCSKKDDGDFDSLISKIGIPPDISEFIERNKFFTDIDINCAFPRLGSNLTDLKHKVTEGLRIRQFILTRFAEELAKHIDWNDYTLDRGIVSLEISSIAGDVLQYTRRNSIESVLWASAMQNSSTNSNRRRAAYILKTYFCDDLTPLNIVAPVIHSKNKHASDAGCAACHFKLDPLGGYFRHIGIGGIDFTANSYLIFDDRYSMSGTQKSDYLNQWPQLSNDGRKFRAGFIRSTTNSSLNDYGNDLDDLFATIKRAPEVKRCLTKRMAEYVLGVNQVYDGGWIDYLAQKFSAHPNSSLAFKEVYRELLLSKTFSHPEPEQNQCYDYPPNATATGLPCAVSHILEKNCYSCHQGDSASGGLNLSSWEHGWFRHRNPQQLSKAESIQRITNSLSTSDPARQMPLDQYMNAADRAALFKWMELEKEKQEHVQ